MIFVLQRNRGTLTSNVYALKYRYIMLPMSFISTGIEKLNIALQKSFQSTFLHIKLMFNFLRCFCFRREKSVAIPDNTGDVPTKVSSVHLEYG